RETEAIVGNQKDDASADTANPLTTGGDLRISARNDGWIGSVAISGAFKSSGADAAPQGPTGMPGSTGDSGGISISGAVVINIVDDNARAYIRHAGALTITGGDLVLTANSDPLLVSIAGGVALSLGAGDASSANAGGAGAVGLNFQSGSDSAFVDGAASIDPNSVSVDANRSDQIFSITAAVAGAKARTAIAIAGSV